MSTATALHSAMSEGQCPGLRWGRGPCLSLATLTLVRRVFPQGQKGESGEMVSSLVGESMAGVSGAGEVGSRVSLATPF